MTQDYKATLHLPATDFPMRGDLPKREPDTLAFQPGGHGIATAPGRFDDLRQHG